MDCNKCNNKPICTIYTDLLEYNKYVDINITNCRYFYKILSASINSKIAETDTILFKNSTDTKNKDYEKIKELSNINAMKKKEIEKENLTNINNFDDKIKVIAINNDNSKTILDTKCPTCGAMTFKEDLIPCSECGKIICSACGTIDNANSKRILCDDCWLK